MSYKTINSQEAMKLQKEGRPLIGYLPPGKEVETWEFADEKKVSPGEIARGEAAKATTDADVAESNARTARAKANKAKGEASLAETEADDLEEKAEELRDVADKAKAKASKSGEKTEDGDEPTGKKKKKKKNQ